ncbi:RNA polymerase sigma factor [Parablautia intestinalis]|uniref:RNA polymerase sigma factor n=1 Tax=Parablautia intestinalis TaxID=2320100 RepID=A0A3A9ALG8_9FIRM|nr:RNA polymerase sigma factor [Parablautia intestinalis]RKI92292.1 RNA polymerase sigma factor [Parablautia intestinalis]
MNERQFEEAVARMVQGDKNALKEIYENYAGYVYRIIYEVLQNKENAEDVTSDFFIRLWERAEQFKPGNGHRGYLAAMARNMAIDFLRKHRREELTALLQDLGTEPEDGGQKKGNYMPQGENGVEQEVIGAMTVTRALEMLKPAERQIVSLKVLGELTFKEIAAHMEIPMGTVTWKYQNAMKKLRRCGYE